MRHMVILIALAAAALVGACAPAVPDEPTWTEDVRPILVANCVRCHSPPAIQGAPRTIRFDKYDDDLNINGSPERYAALSESMIMAQRVTAETMPPVFPLFPRQQDVIDAWAAAGAPKGPPLEGNREPVMELTADFSEEGGVLRIPYRIDDADSDLVTGRFLAEPNFDGDPIIVTFDLFSGNGTVLWDWNDIDSGSYDLSAVIDDGSAEVTFDFGSVDVP
jgi:mono/diheme cytochrome c family protein